MRLRMLFYFDELYLSHLNFGQVRFSDVQNLSHTEIFLDKLFNTQIFKCKNRFARNKLTESETEMYTKL